MTKPRNFVEQGLEENYIAVAGEDYFQIYNKTWSGEILKASSNNERLRVLDCGCGLGMFLNELSGRYREVYGLEPSISLLLNSERNSKKIEVITSLGEAIGFRSASFDMVFCRGTLHHFHDLEKGLSEINRVLKNDGWLVFSEPCRDNLLWRYINILYKKLSPRFGEGHILFTGKELDRIFNKAGFTIEHRTPFGYLAFPLGAIPYRFNVFKYIPFNMVIMRGLIFLDKILGKCPVLNAFNWHVIGRARKHG